LSLYAGSEADWLAQMIDLAKCVYKKLLAEFGMERKWLYEDAMGGRPPGDAVGRYHHGRFLGD
jgi:hypothetical protein